LQSIVISQTKAETLGSAAQILRGLGQMPAWRHDENQGEARQLAASREQVYARTAVLNVAKSSARSGGGDLF
jgi:hypothetical protein